jgi:hypothetical protein
VLVRWGLLKFLLSHECCAHCTRLPTFVETSVEVVVNSIIYVMATKCLLSTVSIYVCCSKHSPDKKRLLQSAQLEESARERPNAG